MSSSVDRIRIGHGLESVRLTSNCVIKRLFGKVAGLIGGIEDLVVENREVQCEAEADGMGWSEIGRGYLGGRFISFQRLVGRILALIADGKFGQIAVIVTLPVIAFSNLTSLVTNRLISAYIL